MRFLITYSGNLDVSQGERPNARLEDINSIEELLALHDAEKANQPDDVRGLILLRIECDYSASFLEGLPTEAQPEWEIEVYDYYRE